MEDNYFTVLWWFLPYINLNQPQCCLQFWSAIIFSFFQFEFFFLFIFIIIFFYFTILYWFCIMSLGHLWNKSCECISNESFRFHSNSTNHEGIKILVTAECSGSGPQSLRWRLFDLLWLLCSFIQCGRGNHLETQMLGVHKPCPKK